MGAPKAMRISMTKSVRIHAMRAKNVEHPMFMQIEIQ
jgi:hypothetical protein